MPALIGRRDSEVERCRRRQRRTVADFFAGSPAHVPEEILLVHREDGLAALLRQLIEAAGDFRVTGRVAERAQRRDRALGVVQKTVEIDGNQLCRLERAQIFGIAHPATRKVPAALGSRARRAIEVRALRVRQRLSDLDVGPIRFGPWLRRVVPIAVQNDAIRHAYHASIELAGLEALGAIHPECVLLFQRVEVRQCLRCVGRARVEPDHRGEVRRLAAREIVSAIPVGDVGDLRDQIREVVEHVLHEIGPAALHQTEHREVRIPVVDLAKAAARNDVRFGQRNQRRAGVAGIRRPRENGPKTLDVLGHALRGNGAITIPRGRGQSEVLLHKVAEHESRPYARRVIPRDDRRRSGPRSRVDEFLRIREDSRELDVRKQRPEIMWRIVVRRPGGRAARA